MSGVSTPHPSFDALDVIQGNGPTCESGSGNDGCSPHCFGASCHGVEREWAEKQTRSPEYLHQSYEEKHQHTPVPSTNKVEDPDAYLRKPIESWGYADVIFFLMEACKELRINPSDVKFKRSDDGSVLLRMTPSDFEILAPNRGQILYDYFINFKTQHYMASEARNVQPSYNYDNSCSDFHTPYMSQEGPPLSHPQDHHHRPIDRTYSHHHHQHPQHLHKIQSPPETNLDSSTSSSVHYNQFPNSPYNCVEYPYNGSNKSESPSNEYVPQGSQYMGQSSASDTSPVEPPHRKSYDLPSAAWKTFPPLHNYDEPLSDPDEFEDEPPAEPPKKRGPGRPPKPESERKRRPKKTGRLWEFIRNLLLDPKTCPSLLRWEDAHAGIFRIVQSDAIANKWGMRKNNENMNYEKLSRAMRYYYKAKIFEPVLGKRLVYKFGSNAKGWRPLNPNNPNFQNF